MHNGPLALDHPRHNQAMERERLRLKPLVIGMIWEKKWAISSKTEIVHDHKEVQCLATICGCTNKHYPSAT